MIKSIFLFFLCFQVLSYLQCEYKVKYLVESVSKHPFNESLEDSLKNGALLLFIQNLLSLNNYSANFIADAPELLNNVLYEIFIILSVVFIYL